MHGNKLYIKHVHRGDFWITQDIFRIPQDAGKPEFLLYVVSEINRVARVASFVLFYPVCNTSRRNLQSVRFHTRKHRTMRDRYVYYARHTQAWSSTAI